MSRLNTLTFTATLLLALISALLYKQQSHHLQLFTTVTPPANYLLTTAKDRSGSLLSSFLSPNNKIQAQQPVTRAQDNTSPAAMSAAVPRTIRKVFLAAETAEGVGATVRRSIGTPHLRNFTPFLMLDHFSVKPGAGFPDQ